MIIKNPIRMKSGEPGAVRPRTDDGSAIEGRVRGLTAPGSPRHRGFTLVEMLISVALVLLMMTMFAQIFQMAGGSISKMRGIAENDQRARTLQTVLKADLDKRTFRWVYPFAGAWTTVGGVPIGEDPNAAESNITYRQGYFYISENNPYDSTDDVIQFTMMSTITVRSSDQTPYYGQALTLFDPSTSSAVQSPFVNLPNQPDADDALLLPNNIGQSTAVEVAYFLRNGNLYRRQLLIRQPLQSLASRTQPDDAGSSSIGANLFDAGYAAKTTIYGGYGGAPGYQWQLANNPSSLGAFWGDFDYSAVPPFLGTQSGAQFLGVSALDNGGTATNVLGIPAFRFGFAPTLTPTGGTAIGRPKEFGLDFLGRYTLQECSSPSFNYPQALAAASGGTPTDPAYAAALARDASGLVRSPGVVTSPDNLSVGLRRGEDLIMPNVHSFDIQVWDQKFQGFVNIGDPNVAGDYGLANRYWVQGGGVTPGYGPRTAENLGTGVVNAVFDTWHPAVGVDYNGDGLTPEPPPYQPVYFRPNAVTGNAADIPSWQPSSPTPYTVGQLVFPTAATLAKSPAFPFVYRCIVASTNPPGPNSGATEPTWPKDDGATVSELTPTLTPVWEAVENRKPLKAIKIAIRFVDPSTQQMRQLTVIHSLVD